MLLQRIGSPFFDEAAESIRISDLVLAIMVCSLPYERARKALQKTVSVRWMFIMAALSIQFAVRPWLFGKRVLMFHDYLAEACAQPDMFGTKKGRPMGCPSLAAQKVVLMAELGYSAAEVMSMPPSQAFWEVATLRELQGALEIPNQAEQQVVEELRKGSN
jgi:hypothetical protein